MTASVTVLPSIFLPHGVLQPNDAMIVVCGWHFTVRLKKVVVMEQVRNQQLTANNKIFLNPKYWWLKDYIVDNYKLQSTVLCMCFCVHHKHEGGVKVHMYYMLYNTEKKGGALNGESKRRRVKMCKYWRGSSSMDKQRGFCTNTDSLFVLDKEVRSSCSYCSTNSHTAYLDESDHIIP